MVVDENTLDKSVSQSPTRSKCADSWCGHVLRIYKRKGHEDGEVGELPNTRGKVNKSPRCHLLKT